MEQIIMFLLREVTKLQVDYEPLGLLIFYSLHTHGQNAEHSLIITALCVFFVASYDCIIALYDGSGTW